MAMEMEQAKGWRLNLFSDHAAEPAAKIRVGKLGTEYQQFGPYRLTLFPKARVDDASLAVDFRHCSGEEIAAWFRRLETVIDTDHLFFRQVQLTLEDGTQSLELRADEAVHAGPGVLVLRGNVHGRLDAQPLQLPVARIELRGESLVLSLPGHAPLTFTSQLSTNAIDDET